MSDTVIRAEGLGKKYRLGKRVESHPTLRDAMAHTASSPLRALKRMRRHTLGDRSAARPDDFWALHDINFDVHRGEVLGVIGRNGAGKSTLLKLLSNITEPTQGRIMIEGRVASLLEVGTGFHPELSGRENIYLNGAILGMTRREIRGKFDEIVDFAGVERFVDTPVKHYSSGMYLRLAFAVSAHLEPEVLLVDEVLAVGDAQFQKKCLGRMQGVAKAGRTVVFVSHNMSAIKQLCPRSLYLSDGRLIMDCSTDEVVVEYMNAVKTSDAVVDLSAYRSAYGNDELEVISIALANEAAESFTIPWDEPLSLRIRIKARESVANVSIAIGLQTLDGLTLFTVRSTDEDSEGLRLHAGQIADMNVTIRHNVRAGSFEVMLGIASGSYNYYYNPAAAHLNISNVGTAGYLYKNHGVVNCAASWTC